MGLIQILIQLVHVNGLKQQSNFGGVLRLLVSHLSCSLQQVTEAFTQSRAFAQLKLPKPGEYN